MVLQELFGSNHFPSSLVVVAKPKQQLISSMKNHACCFVVEAALKEWLRDLDHSVLSETTCADSLFKRSYLNRKQFHLPLRSIRESLSLYMKNLFWPIMNLKLENYF